MPQVRTAARALILRDGLLLVACYQDDQGEWFTLPGGGQQHGEELTSTLARECLEETGFHVRIGPLRFVREVIATRYPTTSLPDDFHQVEHIFACEVDDLPAGEPLTPDPSQTGCRWLSVGELRTRRFFPRKLLESLESPHVVYLGAAQ
jgi:8-oxo-dGTP diphosphatase